MEAGSIVQRPDAAACDNVRRDMWGAVATGWAEYADEIDERVIAATERMLDLAALKPGDRVLELACGPGGAGLVVAERVGTDGEVVLSDVAAEMTAVAAERAARLGLRNVTTCEHDLEAIGEPDAAFDAAICREGLMFAPDPGRAVHEIARVLRPGGRAVVSTWGPRERNPWLALVMEVAGGVLGRPVPPPGVPGVFSLGDAAELAGLFEDAGLAGVAVEEISVPLRAASFEEWWSRPEALAAPLVKMLGTVPGELRQEMRARAREAARDYETAGGGYEFPGVTLVASGRKP
jgi:SAM-dependent methyltransferase